MNNERPPVLGMTLNRALPTLISADYSLLITYSAAPLTTSINSKQFHSCLNSKVSLWEKTLNKNFFERPAVLVISPFSTLKADLAVPFYTCQLAGASHFHFPQLLMPSCGNAAQRTQGNRVPVFPDGGLPAHSTLWRVTEGIHLLANPKSIISGTPRVHCQLTAAAGAMAKRQMERERQTARKTEREGGREGRRGREGGTGREEGGKGGREGGRCCFKKFSPTLWHISFWEQKVFKHYCQFIGTSLLIVGIKFSIFPN